MDFATFVRAKRTDRTPRGHFIELVSTDAGFPAKVEHWKEIEAHLRAKRATRTAVKAASAAALAPSNEQTTNREALDHTDVARYYCCVPEMTPAAWPSASASHKDRGGEYSSGGHPASMPKPTLRHGPPDVSLQFQIWFPSVALAPLLSWFTFQDAALCGALAIVRAKMKDPAGRAQITAAGS
jgi:hypothetical protein